MKSLFAHMASIIIALAIGLLVYNLATEWSGTEKVKSPYEGGLSPKEDFCMLFHKIKTEEIHALPKARFKKGVRPVVLIVCEEPTI